MRAIVLLVVVGLAAVTAVPLDQQRIVGGSTVTISEYPQAAALLKMDYPGFFTHACGGVIVNSRSILTAAHCLSNDIPNTWRARLGSAEATGGGTIYDMESFTLHPAYNFAVPINNDIAMMRTDRNIAYVSNAVQPALIAGPSYNIPDGTSVLAVGWGSSSFTGWPTGTLRHAQLNIIEHNICASRYTNLDMNVRDTMLCAGLLSGGRGQCHGDSGGPLFHNRVVVGICSYSDGCGDFLYPGINTRVSNYTDWIISNA